MDGLQITNRKKKKSKIKSYTDLLKINSPYYFDLHNSLKKEWHIFSLAVIVKEICHMRLNFLGEHNVVKQPERKKMIN